MKEFQRERETDFLSAGSLPKWPQCLELGWSSQEPGASSMSLMGGGRSKDLGHLLLFSQRYQQIAGSRV